MPRRTSVRTVLLLVTGLGLLGFIGAAGLALLGVPVSPLVAGGLGMLCIWVPTALCWMAVLRVGRRRPEVMLAAAAVTSWTVGTTFWFLLDPPGVPAPTPTPADIGSALFYALMAAALVVAARRQARGVASWLTGVACAGK